MTKLDELRKSSEAAKEGITKSLMPSPIVFVEADTILAMCDLLEQMREVVEGCINDPRMRHTDTVHYATQDVLAAFDKWNGVE